jgi:DNA-3-methyladenine glycosylase
MGRADALKPGCHKDGHPPLTRSELPIDTVSLARYLIGKILVRELPEGVASGRIVETEAYVVGDAAGHAYRGMTRRNRSLFLECGHAYIYLAYGSSYMLNVSSEMPGIGAGVLIRALEPLEGTPIMQLNRGIERLRDLARGSGRLTAALRVDRRLDGLDLSREGPLWLGRGPSASSRASPLGTSSAIAAGPNPASSLKSNRARVGQAQRFRFGREMLSRPDGTGQNLAPGSNRNCPGG